RHCAQDATGAGCQTNKVPGVSPGSDQAPRGGIDLVGTKIQTVVVDSGDKVMGESRRPTPTTGGPGDVLRERAAALRDAAAQADLGTRDLSGVGVGSPGDADEKTGVVSDARNLPGWVGAYPMAEKLSEQLGAPVRIGNDVDVAVRAEFELGAGKDFNTILG